MNTTSVPVNNVPPPHRDSGSDMEMALHTHRACPPITGSHVATGHLCAIRPPCALRRRDALAPSRGVLALQIKRGDVSRGVIIN